MNLNLYRFVFIFFVLLLPNAYVYAQSERDTGIEFYRQNNYQEAIKILEVAATADKKDRLAWMYLGMSYAKLGNDGKALKNLRKANGISVKKTSIDNYYDQEAKITAKPRPRYTDAAKRSLTTGRVTLAIEFGANGKDIYIVPLYGLPDGLTEECVLAAQKIKFDPAIKGGKAISSIKIIEHSFDIF